MSIDSKDSAQNVLLTGRFTSAATAADVTETLPWAPSCVIAFIAVGATSPNMYVYTAALTTETMLTTGTTGVITTPAAASGLTVNTTLNTVLFPSGIQTNDGVNFWIAFK